MTKKTITTEEAKGNSLKPEFQLGGSWRQEFLDKAVDLGVINKSGSWFAYEDVKLGQGRDAVKQMISDNPELSQEIEVKIKTASSKE